MLADLPSQNNHLKSYYKILIKNNIKTNIYQVPTM